MEAERIYVVFMLHFKLYVCDLFIPISSSYGDYLSTLPTKPPSIDLIYEFITNFSGQLAHNIIKIHFILTLNMFCYLIGNK